MHVSVTIHIICMFHVILYFISRDGKQVKLLREIVALAQLDHVHIVRYYHSWKERAPENWQDRQGWEEMRSRFLLASLNRFLEICDLKNYIYV